MRNDSRVRLKDMLRCPLVHVVKMLHFRRRGTDGVEPLIRLLDTSWVETRSVAARLLGELGDPRAVAPLIQLLVAEEGWIREIAAKALQQLGETKWVKYVSGSYDDFVRLGDCQDDRIVEPLIRVLDKGLQACERSKSQELDPESHAAVEALGGLRDKRAVDALIKSLENGSNKDREAAARSLAEIGDAGGVAPLVRTMACRTGGVRKAIAEALEQLGDGKWTEWFKGDNNDFQRLRQCEDQSVIDQVVDLLIEELKTGDSDTRQGAAWGLGQLGDPRAVEPLIRALEVERADGDFCKLAAEALGKIGDARAFEPLVNVLESRQGKARFGAVWGLGALGDPRAVEPLIRAIEIHKGADQQFRVHAAEALGKIGDSRAFKPLVSLLTSGEGQARVGAAWGLGTLGDPRAVEPLITALDDGSEHMLKWSSWALGELGDSRAVKPLLRVLTTHNWKNRGAIVEALQKLGAAKWAEWIRGDNDDVQRLKDSSDPEAVAVAYQRRTLSLGRTLSFQCENCGHHYILGGNAWVVTSSAVMGAFKSVTIVGTGGELEGTEDDPDLVDEFHGDMETTDGSKLSRQETEIGRIRQHLAGGRERWFKCNKCKTVQKYRPEGSATHGNDPMDASLEGDATPAAGVDDQTICYYCKAQPASGDSDVCVYMHGNVQAQRVPFKDAEYQVTWQEQQVTVPRCELCKEYHERYKEELEANEMRATEAGNTGFAHGCLASLALGALVNVGVYMMFSEQWNRRQATWWYMGGSVFATFIVMSMLSVWWSECAESMAKKRYGPPQRRKGVKDERSVHEYGSIARLRRDGWECGKEPSEFEKTEAVLGR